MQKKVKSTTTFEIVPLKIYWQNEQNDLATKKHTQRNAWIDEVLMCTKFALFNLRACIDYGDYLFLAITAKKVSAFAICVDHPSPKWKIFNNSHIAQPQGFLEIAIINSDVKGQGSALLSQIENFAKRTLQREYLQLEMANIALQPYYILQGFVSVRNKIMRKTLF